MQASGLSLYSDPELLHPQELVLGTLRSFTLMKPDMDTPGRRNMNVCLCGLWYMWVSCVCDVCESVCLIVSACLCVSVYVHVCGLSLCVWWYASMSVCACTHVSCACVSIKLEYMGWPKWGAWARKPSVLVLANDMAESLSDLLEPPNPCPSLALHSEAKVVCGQEGGTVGQGHLFCIAESRPRTQPVTA